MNPRPPSLSLLSAAVMGLVLAGASAPSSAQALNSPQAIQNQHLLEQQRAAAESQRQLQDAAAARSNALQTQQQSLNNTQQRLRLEQLERNQTFQNRQRAVDLNEGYTHVVRTRVQEALRGPQLGVVLAEDSSAGVRIGAVTPDGAAAKAGLRSGDRILSIDGRPLDADDSASRVVQARGLLAGMKVGRTVQIGYLRDGKRATANALPQVGDRVIVVDNPDGGMFGGLDPSVAPGADSVERAGPASVPPANPGANPKANPAPNPNPKPNPTPRPNPDPSALSRRVQAEIYHLASGAPCEKGECRTPVLNEIMRWNGLNLAAVNPQLGRYFGATRGVLVLNPGPHLIGLQSGDVIQSIGGTNVNTPSDAMRALRERTAGSEVSVAYLRDRKAGTARLKLPAIAKFTLPPPPAPPIAPRPPGPPKPLSAARPMQPPGPPAPPAPPTPPANE